VIALLAVLGGLGFLGLVIAGSIYLFDTPARFDRVRAEIEAQEAAWRIQQHTRHAIESMLAEARKRRRPDAS
jgi:hypothetical protein